MNIWFIPWLLLSGCPLLASHSPSSALVFRLVMPRYQMVWLGGSSLHFPEPSFSTGELWLPLLHLGPAAGGQMKMVAALCWLQVMAHQWWLMAHWMVQMEVVSVIIKHICCLTKLYDYLWIIVVVIESMHSHCIKLVDAYNIHKGLCSNCRSIPCIKSTIVCITITYIA